MKKNRKLVLLLCLSLIITMMPGRTASMGETRKDARDSGAGAAVSAEAAGAGTISISGDEKEQDQEAGETGESRGETEESIGETEESREKTGETEESRGETGESRGETEESIGETEESREKTGETEESRGETGETEETREKTAETEETRGETAETEETREKTAETEETRGESGETADSTAETEETRGETGETEDSAGDTTDTEESTAETADPAETRAETAAAEETPADPAETIEETAGQVPFNETRELFGVRVNVSARAGVFPADATLHVSRVPARDTSMVEEAVEGERSDDAVVAVSYIFDIEVKDADGKKIQPAGDVRISFSAAAARSKNLDAQIYHVTEKGSADALDSDTHGSTVSAVTDGFSYYVVEFTYEGLTYTLEGGASVPLAYVISAVGLKGEVSSASVSNPALFDVVKEDGIWMLHSYLPFETEEWLKAVIDGIEYEIMVTDDGSLLASGTWNTCTWTLDADYNFVVKPSGIAGVIGDTNGEQSRYPWHPYRSQVKTVTFEGAVTASSNLKFMFAGCTALESVDFGSLDTSAVGFMGRMFLNCSSLKNIDFGSGFSTGNVKGMTEMFRGCSSLSSLDLSGFNTSNATSMDYMFAGCSSLTSLDLSGFRTPNVTLMQNMFNGCSSLSSLDLSGFRGFGIEAGECRRHVQRLQQHGKAEPERLQTGDHKGHGA